jgi:AraC family transcriptional regulator
LAEDLSIVALARVAQTSPFHFTRLFKASMCLTPHQYVLQQRVENAKRLLTEDKLTISEIAHECGFANQAHLTTAFHRHTGATPQQFRYSEKSAAVRTATFQKNSQNFGRLNL